MVVQQADPARTPCEDDHTNLHSSGEDQHDPVSGIRHRACRASLWCLRTKLGMMLPRRYAVSCKLPAGLDHITT